MNADQLKALTEIEVMLPKVVADLEKLGGLWDEVRGLPGMEKKLEETYHRVFIGDGEANPPLVQRVAAVEKDVRKAAARNGLGPKERATLYTAMATALAAAAKAYMNGG